MSKKSKPRWGDHGATEVADFELSAGKAQEIAAILGITNSVEVQRLAAELNDIGCQYLRWIAQDEQGPSRAERNAALEQVVETSRCLEQQLKALDHATESILVDALPPYLPPGSGKTVDSGGTVKQSIAELGFSQIEALRHRLSHFNSRASALLRRQKHRGGPDPKKTLPAIVDTLADIFERETGMAPTHTPFKDTEYKSGPQSQAGRFIALFIEIVDPKVPPSTVSSTLAEVLKKRRAQVKANQ